LKQLSAVSSQLSVRSDSQPKSLPLAELEALSGALLPVLLAFFGARVTGYHALGLELAAQFRIELHKSARDAEAHRIGLSSDSAAADVGQHVECSRTIGRDQGRLRGDALRGGHEIFVEPFAVNLELAAAWTKKNPRDRGFAPSGSVVLNCFSH